MKEENASYRPEQLLIAGLLREIDPFKKNYSIKTEHRVDLEDFDGKRTSAVLDIALIPNQSKSYTPMGIRIMGEIHEKEKKILKDADQKSYLENRGWRIYDIYKYSDECFWQPKKHESGYLKDKLMKIILG